MPKLSYRGDSAYRGFDMGVNRPLRVEPGDEVEVSEGKATQLLRDFPRDWKDTDDDEVKSTAPTHTKPGKVRRRK